jgi:hypothetical protein
VPSATGRVFSAWREGLQMALRDISRQCGTLVACRAKRTLIQIDEYTTS